MLATIERQAMKTTPGRRVLLLSAVFATGAAGAHAADPPPPPGWYTTGGLSYVLTSGNAGTSSLGLKAEVKRLWTNATFSLGGGLVRATANDPGRRAVGGPDQFDVESGPSVLNAARYNALAHYDRNVSERLGWETGLEFYRDEFSGLEGRTLALAGVRYLVANQKSFVFKTAAAATFAHQSDVVEDPLTSNSFVGARASADIEKTLGANSKYVMGLALDENLQDTDDLRIRFANALGVSMNKRLALQVGLLLLYDHQPSLVEIPLFDRVGVPSGLTVAAEAAKLDTTFTVSMVMNFGPRAATP